MTLSVKISAVAAAAVIATVLAAPRAYAHEDISHYLFVPNRASADVAVIDTHSDRVIARIAVGNVPHQVVASAALGKLIVSNTADDTVSIIDAATFETLATVALDIEPEHMAVSPNGEILAVGNFGAGTVSLLSLIENREIARIGGLFKPHNLTFGADGATLFVANLGANHVSVIDVAAAALINEISVAGPTVVASVEKVETYQGIINVTRVGGLGFAAHGMSDSLAVIDLESQRTVKRIAVGDRPWRAYGSPDGRYMVTPNNGDHTISVVSSETLEVVATLPGAAGMTGVNFDRSGATAYVISRGENKLVILDLVAMKTLGAIALASSPETGVVSPDGNKLYVALSGSDQVAVIDLATRALTATIDDVGSAPWGTTIIGAAGYCH